MPEKEDLNTNQPVTGTDLNKEQSVATPDLNNATGQGKLADGTDENKTVPYSELKKAIDEKNAAEKLSQEQAQQHRDQMLMMQNNQPQQVPTQPQTTMDKAMSELGVTAEDMFGETMINVMNRKAQLDVTQNQQNNAAYANQQFEMTHTDFASVVGLRSPINGQVQPSAEILKILTEKPYLTAAAYASSQGAYEIVMQERENAKLRQQNTVNQEHLNTQTIDNKLAPVSGAAAAGGAINNQAQGAITLSQQEENERKIAAGELT